MMSPGVQLSARSGDGSFGHEAIELLKTPSPTTSGLKAAPALPHKARWLTPEFLVYIGFLAFCFWQGIGLVWEISNSLDPRVHRMLRPGWMFGRRVDVSDGQYRFFREELPTLTAAALLFLALSHAVRHFSNNSLRARLYFYASFSFAFLLFANGSCTAFMVAIVAVNYLISSLGARGWGRTATAATWLFNSGILLLNERYHGYRWSSLLGVGGLGGESWSSPLGQAAVWLDGHRGQFPWFRLFNLVVLRMISFNLDRVWAAQSRPIVERDGSILSFEKHARKEKEHQPLSGYNPLSYFCYLFYVPLHFAGPTTTFNSWMSHVARPQRKYTTEGLLRYFLVKVVFIFLVLEWWLHSLYVFALTNSSAFLSLSAYGMALTSYFTLIGIWLKFTALWRYFRMWALLDGVEPPENMERCVSNNYSIQSFWRAWHRSFNRWLVRYIYVPLGGGGGGGSGSGGAAAAAGAAAVSGSGFAGGSGSSALSSSSSSSPSSFLSSHPKVRSVLQQSFNIFVTFSFVAFWHDRTMQLLAWGWIVALLFVPELAATAMFNTRQLSHVKKEWYWRHIKGIGAALSIFTMMIANLIGYSVGIDGTSSILSTMVNEGGVSMFLVVFAAFFSASMLMFEFRETGITVD